MILLNQGKRAYIVSPDDVLKGGELDREKKHMYINPEATVEVTEKCGKFLLTYSDFKLIDAQKKGVKK